MPLLLLVENKAHFVLEHPMYNSIGDKFQLFFEIVVLRSVKSFFWLGHQDDI